MSIEDYRNRLLWSVAQLARKAELDKQTIYKAEKGLPIREHSALKIARVLSDALGENITINDLDGLKVFK